MITEMTLRNFKCWRQLGPLACRRLTILFGANSSGKSSVLQALLALKQTAESYDRKRAFSFGGTPRDLVDLGSYRDVVFGHDLSARVGVALRWAARGEAADERGLEQDPLRYEALWALTEDEVALERLRYVWGKREVVMERLSDGAYKATYKGMKRRRGRPSHARPESCYAIPPRAGRELTDFDLLDFNDEFELLMARVHHLGPLREHPARTYPWTGEAPQSVGPRGEDAISALLAARRQKENSSRAKRRGHGAGLVDSTQAWLRRLELADELSVKPIDRDRRFYEAWLRPRGGGPGAALPDVGFGISQVLPVIVSVLFVPEGSILLLEQPELHLHPSVQAGLADLFLEVAHARDLQLIIESHSEHLLRRLQRRIAEAQAPGATPEEVALYFCAVREGEAHPEAVEVDLFGTIENWPDGFFGDEVGDLEAMALARARRKREARGG